MIHWLAAVLALVFLWAARGLVLSRLFPRPHPARRADCPVVRSGRCPPEHDCEEHQ